MILGITIIVDTEHLVQLNITDLMNKLDILVQSWKTRTLTPLGKIAVINSLMVSIFVYKLTYLPSLEKIHLE